MNYKITEQYARGEEKLIAEMNGLNEAKLLIRKKSAFNEDAKKKVIYRIYNNDKLLHEVNYEGISVAYAQYAEGNVDFNISNGLIFRVMVNVMDTSEKEIIAQFREQTDASLFVTCKCEINKGNSSHQSDLFFIFKDKVLIDTINQTKLLEREKKSEGSGRNEKGSAYHLSPLSQRPTPGGGPPDYWVKNKAEDDK
ncbi:MAG: hypothetical protein K0U37_03430 [Gammaproteobacteria bacterium]|nr:hypothetical protein [Gammaproteobacteria bacterium]